MSDVKREMIFGDESLFDGAPEDAEAVGGGKPLQDALVFYKFSDGEFQYKYEAEIDDWKVSTCKHPQSVIKAMRRIIKEPKRWTVEDQKAGKLPEVGSKLIYTETWDEFEFVGVIAGSMRWACKDFQDGFLYFFEQSEMSPIESPEEKARRERDAWARKASEFIDDELDCVNLVGEHVMRRFYNAMLSGDLPVPNKESE